MKICFINPVAELGGAERSLLDLCWSLTRDGKHDLRLLAFAEGPLLAKMQEVGVRSTVLPLPGSVATFGESALRERASAGRTLRALLQAPALLSFVRRLRKTLRQLAPDVVHSNGMKAHVLSVAAVPRSMPLVLHVRDYLSERPLAPGLLRAALRPLHVIANSRSVAEDVRSVLPAAKVAVMYNGVDTQKFCPGPAERQWLASLSGLPEPPPDTPSIGLVATYARWKGHEVVLRALAKLEVLLGRSVRGYLVGGPIYRTSGSQHRRADLEKVAADCGIAGHVGFVGFRDDVERIYRSLDVVVHASTRREAFGRTIVEAMACGRPVVAMQAGGACELFEDGVDALGCTPRDPAMLAARVLTLVQDRKLGQDLGRRARERALARFDRTRLGRDVLGAYDSLLGRGASIG